MGVYSHPLPIRRSGTGVSTHPCHTIGIFGVDLCSPRRLRPSLHVCRNGPRDRSLPIFTDRVAWHAIRAIHVVRRMPTRDGS